MSMLNFGFKFNFDKFSKNSIAKLDKRVKKDLRTAQAKAAVIFLTHINTTRPKPPIKTGVLRGKSVAFVGRKKVSVGDPTVLTPNSPPIKLDATDTLFGYNTPYAHRQHEEWGKFGPGGPFSRQDGGVGRKFLETHMKKDREYLTKLTADFAKQESLK